MGEDERGDVRPAMGWVVTRLLRRLWVGLAIVSTLSVVAVLWVLAGKVDPFAVAAAFLLVVAVALAVTAVEARRDVSGLVARGDDRRSEFETWAEEREAARIVEGKILTPDQAQAMATAAETAATTAAKQYADQITTNQRKREALLARIAAGRDLLAAMNPPPTSPPTPISHATAAARAWLTGEGVDLPEMPLEDRWGSNAKAMQQMQTNNGIRRALERRMIELGQKRDDL